MPGGDQTLLDPDLASHGGEGVGEGRPRLTVPGAARDPEPGAAVEASRQQSDYREQAEQAGRGAQDGQRSEASLDGAGGDHAGVRLLQPGGAGDAQPTRATLRGATPSGASWTVRREAALWP